MLGPGGGDGGLVDGGHGAVGVGLETEESLGSGDGQTGGENLEKEKHLSLTLKDNDRSLAGIIPLLLKD